MGKKFVILDDHPAIRFALRSYIEAAGHHVRGEGGSLAEGRQFLVSGDSDFLIIDLVFGDGEGYDFIREWRQINQQGRILVFSTCALRASIQSAFEAGADGFFCKVDNLDFLPSAFEELLSGGTFLSSRARKGLEQVAERDDSPGLVESEILSPKEKMILNLLGEGFTRKEISQKCQLGVQTIETHLRRVTMKLGLDSRRDLVRYAIDRKKDPDL